jgi:hypothetical protein
MSIEKNRQNEDISVMATEVPIYQQVVSSEIKGSLSNILHIINQETFSYVLNMDSHIRNNIKDSSFLKKSLIEKIHSNMGD